jgi:hypothetical protein
MAGQPNEPWQSYSPPPADDQGTYAYPQPGRPGSQSAGSNGGQAFARPAAGYPGGPGAPGYQDEPYGGRPPADETRRDLPIPGMSGQDQGYQGAHGYPAPPGYAAPPDQAPPHWQAGPDHGAPARGRGETKGFFGALFDFSFNSFVTPKIIKALYVLATVWMIVWALIFLRLGFKYGGATGGVFTLVVVDPIFLLLTLGGYRVVLEFFMVIHRMHDDLKAIRERADERG